MTFGRAFTVGALIALISSCCYVTAWEVVYFKFMPDFTAKMTAHTVAKARAAGETRLRELTPVPLMVGAVLGLIVGASSLYLVLKVGLTVSASIPVAVMSITIFRLFARLGGRDARCSI